MCPWVRLNDSWKMGGGGGEQDSIGEGLIKTEFNGGIIAPLGR